LKESKAIEEEVSEGGLAIILQNKAEALLWKPVMELFISRTFPASVCLNCILKTSPEKNFTTYPGACQSDRETGKYEFLEESDFQKIHAQASIKITGFFFRSLSGSQQFYRIIGFQNHI